MINTIVKFQIINEDGGFVFPKNHVKEIVQQYPEINNSYKVISIVGSQSSGKSTLFNSVFQTDFKVLDASEGLKQTTKGIWGATLPQEKIFIMDVEGVDSAERWEDGAFFEKSTSLFSLANSDLLIINLWTHDVGRFSGSNLKLLQTIFEINFRLFYKKSNEKEENPKENNMNSSLKKGLLIVLRDFPIQYNLANIKESILNNIQKIWEEIQKPDLFINTNYDIFFNIQFETMANYNFEKEKFDSQARNLYHRFTDPSRTDSYLNNKNKDEDYKVQIPFESLDIYMQNIWGIIRSCKDLDIPSQRVLISEYRCNLIKNEVLKDITIPGLKKLNTELNDKIHTRLKTDCDELIKSSLGKFDRGTSFYSEEIVKAYKIELQDILKEKLLIFVKRQVNMIKLYIKSQIDESFQMLQEKILAKSPFYFYKEWSRIKQELQLEARDMLQQSQVDFLEYDMQRTIIEVTDEVNQRFDDFFQTELQGFTNSFFKKEMQTPIVEKIEKFFKDQKILFWEEFNKFFSEFWKKMLKAYERNLIEGFNLEKKDYEKYMVQLKGEVRGFITAKINGRKEFFHQYVKEIFDYHFTLKDGKERDWSEYTEKQIEDLYENALDFCKKVIDSFKNLEIIEHKIKNNQPGSQDTLVIDDPEFSNLFTESECSNVKNLLLEYIKPMLEVRKASAKRGWLPKLPNLGAVKNFLS